MLKGTRKISAEDFCGCGKAESCHCIDASVKTAVSLMYDGFFRHRLLFSNKWLDLCLPQNNEGTSSWENRKIWGLSETHIKCGLSSCLTAFFCLMSGNRHQRGDQTVRSKQTLQPPTTGCSLLEAGGKQHKPSERVLNKQPYEGKCVWLSDQKPPPVWAPLCPRLIYPCKVR